jgi:hypothetical protein
MLPRSERVEPRRPAAAETWHRWALSPTACEKPQRHVSFATAPTARGQVRVRWAVAAIRHTHPLRTGTGQRKRTASPPSAERQSSAARAVIPGLSLRLDGMIGTVKRLSPPTHTTTTTTARLPLDRVPWRRAPCQALTAGWVGL